ncbi:class I SAM-dependent methyltransferase [Pendulispora albinea]|uniref:Class I SAM-dependent methyltransferase n=1 Tax=Pendulispora albinea TaxID=2741071 RepID=A0ABZ2LRI6_9BACT
MKPQSVRLGAVQETLLIPLYGRAQETRKKRALLRDPKAVAMVDAIDYDFRKFDSARSLYGSVLRTAMLDEWIRAFIARNPEGTVIEVGAGLNTRFERLDNGTIHWVDLDLPDSMDLRRKFFQETERRRLVAASVLDEDWKAIVRDAPGPYFFVVEAVFMYLTGAEVRHALTNIARAFPDSRIAFDTAGRHILANQHRHDVMKKMEARFTWACDEPRELESLGLRLLDSRTLLNPQPDLAARLPFAHRYLMPLMYSFIRKAMRAYTINLFETAPHSTEAAARPSREAPTAA